MVYLLRRKLEDTLLSDEAVFMEVCTDGIASSTMSKLGNNEHASLDVLARIAIALECGMDDVVEIER